jgi:DNA (cytosine-5)-methyltransferase 1
MRDLSYSKIMKLKHLDLFSGIGGFSLGLEATGGFETKAFCDIEKYPRQVLQKHWPHVKQYEDIKELNYERLKADGIDSIDIITGGYPCQPFSIAGRQKGEQDPRHLWPEYFRLVKELRPTWVIGENVSGHIKLGLDTVIEDLESEDYAVRPFSISASSIGANHQRERIWILAHSRRSQWPRAELRGENENETREENANQFERSSSTSEVDVANTNDERLQRQWQSRNQFTPRFNSSRESSEEGQGTVGQGWWESEPNMGRVAHGIPKRVDRLKSLGNSLVPQIPYYIGKTILEVMNGKTN